jgi:hypothetical protein
MQLCTLHYRAAKCKVMRLNIAMLCAVVPEHKIHRQLLFLKSQNEKLNFKNILERFGLCLMQSSAKYFRLLNPGTLFSHFKRLDVVYKIHLVGALMEMLEINCYPAT